LMPASTRRPRFRTYGGKGALPSPSRAAQKENAHARGWLAICQGGDSDELRNGSSTAKEGDATSGALAIPGQSERGKWR
jgi:hypothetical protein